MMKKLFIWPALLGLLIGAFTNWRISYENINFLDSQMWILVGLGSLIAGFLSTLYLKQKPWLVGFLVSLGVVLATILRIVYDSMIVDSTSHNLAPFEVIFSGLQSLPTAMLGAFLATLFPIYRKKSQV